MKRLLIVDDERSNIEILADILGSEYDITVAYNGFKALKLLEKKLFDLILLDIRMPDMSGYEVAEKIQDNPMAKAIPIIFLTSQKDADSIVKGFEVGAVDYVTKPFNHKELRIRISTHLQLNELQHFLQQVLNSIPSMIVLTDGISTKFVNQSFLDYFDFQTLTEFKVKYKNIYDVFIHDDDYFYVGDKIPGSEWIQEMIRLDDRVVSIRSGKDNKIRFFRININSIESERLYILDFHDISDSVKKEQQLIYDVNHDTLTGALTRDYFNESFDTIYYNNKVDGLITAIAMLDIDHFKRINDSFGHDTGDATLVHFVDTLSKISRSTDIVVRWGGEEFVMVLSIDDVKTLQAILEKYRRAIEQEHFPVIDKLTCSIGATIHRPEESIKSTLKRADSALYKSKEGGRNLVYYMK